MSSKENLENWHASTAHAQYFNRRPFVHVVSLTNKTNFPAGRCLFPLVWKTIFCHFNTTKQDRLELCHSELASVSVTIQIRSFPPLLYECVHFWILTFQRVRRGLFQSRYQISPVQSTTFKPRLMRIPHYYGQKKALTFSATLILFKPLMQTPRSYGHFRKPSQCPYEHGWYGRINNWLART